MNKSKLVIIIIAVVILAGAGAVGFWWTMERDEEPVNDEPVEVNDEEEEAITTEMEPPIEIEAEHRFDDGSHTISGSLEVPNECFELNLEAPVTENDIDSVLLEFISRFDEEKDCVEEAVLRSFETDFTAQLEANITAEFDGTPVELVLTEMDDWPDLEPEPEPDPDLIKQ